MRLPTIKTLLVCVALLFPLHAYSFTCADLYEDWEAWSAVQDGAMIEDGSQEWVDMNNFGIYVTGVIAGIIFTKDFLFPEDAILYDRQLGFAVSIW